MSFLSTFFHAPLKSGVRAPAATPAEEPRSDWHYALPVTGDAPNMHPVQSNFQGTNHGDSPTFYTPNGVGGQWIEDNAAALPAKVGPMGIQYPDLPGVPSRLNSDTVPVHWQTSAETGHQTQPIMRGAVNGRDENYSNLRAQLLSQHPGTVGAVSGGDGGGTPAQAFFASQAAILNELAIKRALAYAS